MAGSIRAERQAVWREAVAAQPTSGQSIREFCRQSGLAEAGFYAWRRKLSAGPDSTAVESSASPAFTAVKLVTESAPLTINFQRGATLTARHDCPPDLLRTAIEALRC
jgi:transposase-like protein